MFSSRSSKNEISLVLNIGSGQILAALVKSGELRSEIIFHYQENFNLNHWSTQNPISADERLVLLARFLRIVLAKVPRTKKITNVHVFLSSPWILSQTRVIKLKRQTPFRFKSKMFQTYVEKEICLFEKKILSPLKEEGQEMRLLDKEIFEVRLNGYKTNKPFGELVRDFEIFLFLSASPEQVCDFIAYEVKKFFNQPIHFSSLSLASFLTIRHFFPNEEYFSLINVLGEATDVSLIKNDILIETNSFNLGLNDLIYFLASQLGQTLREAESFLTLFLNNRLAEAERLKLEKVLRLFRDRWLGSFSLSLSILSKNIFLPSTIFLLSDSLVEKWFKSIIELEEWGQYLVTQNKFNVILLDNRLLHRFCRFENKGEPVLAILSMFLNLKS